MLKPVISRKLTPKTVDYKYVENATIHIPISLYLIIQDLKDGKFSVDSHIEVRTSIRVTLTADRLLFKFKFEKRLEELEEAANTRFLTIEELQWFTCLHETQLKKMTEFDYFRVLQTAMKDAK